MMWGILIGTYSSLFIAAPILYYMQPNRRAIAKEPSRRPRRPRRRPSGPRAERPELGPWSLSRSSRPGVRSSSATRRAGSGSAAIIYPGPVLVFPDRTEAWAEPAFTEQGLAPVLAHGGVELLLLGCGRRMRPVAAALRGALKAGGIAVEPMDTGAACRTYNMLVAEDRRVAAALLPPV